MDKKKLTARFLLRLFGVMLAFGVVFGTFSAREAGANAAEKKSSQAEEKLSKKEFRKFIKKFCKVQNFEKVLKRHSSILIRSNHWISYASKDYACTTNDYDKYAVYADKETVYNLSWGDKPYSYYVIGLDKDMDMYDAAETRYYYDNNFTIEAFMKDEPVSLVDNGNGTLTLTAKMNDEDVTETVELWGFDESIKTMYYRITVNSKTYEILSMYAYVNLDDKEPLIYQTYVYDLDEEYAECILMRTMAKRTWEKNVTCTIVVDPGTENEYTRKATIPVGEHLYFVTTELDPVAYSNAKCTKEYGSWDSESDVKLYMKTKKEG